MGLVNTTPSKLEDINFFLSDASSVSDYFLLMSRMSFDWWVAEALVPIAFNLEITLFSNLMRAVWSLNIPSINMFSLVFLVRLIFFKLVRYEEHLEKVYDTTSQQNRSLVFITKV